MRVENRNVPRKTCPRATLSTTNVTCIGLGSNPGLHDVKPAIISLKYIYIYIYIYIETTFLTHRKHSRSPLQRLSG
jgi:hypothetical protein